MALVLVKRNNAFTPFLLFASLFTTVSIIFSFLAVQPVFAQYVPAQPIPNNKLLINKKIFNPQTQQFVDNLSRDQFLFVQSQTVDFQIMVTNTGNTDLFNFDITDQLPAELSFVSGGSLDKGGQPHFSIDKLSPGQSQTFSLKAKTNVNQNTAGIVCPVNLATVKTGSLMDQDTSTFCIQTAVSTGKGAVPAVEQLPKTGLPLVAWSLVGLLPAGLGLKRTLSYKKDNQDKPFYISQKRDFEKES